MAIPIAINSTKTIWIMMYQMIFFISYNNEKLIYQETKVLWDKKRMDYVIEREYYNKDACSNCKFADECCNGKHRVVKITGRILTVNMLGKFEDYSNVLQYVKRFSTVEAQMVL